MLINLLKNEKKLLFLIFTLTLILKLSYVFFVEGIKTHPGVDGVFYDKVAVNLAKGNGFVSNPGEPSTEKPPVYILLLSSLYFIFGHNYISIRIVQAILMGINCILTFLIGKEIKDEKIALLASIFVAFDPLLTQLSAWYLSQTLYITFELLAVYYMIKLQKDYSTKYAIFVGFFLGLASLTISYSSPFFYPFILIWAFLVYKNNLKNVIKSVSIIFIILTIIISVWTIRNYIAFNEFIPIGTASGIRFWGGNNPRAEGVWVPWTGSSRFYFSVNEPGWGKAEDWVDWASQAGSPWLNLQFSKSKGLSANERDLRYWKMGLKWVTNNPGNYFILLCKKFKTYWQYWHPLTTLPRPSKIWRTIGKIYYYPLLVLFIFGIYYSLKNNWNKSLVLYIFILHNITGALIFFGDAGQRAPITPIIFLLSSVGLVNLFSDYIKKNNSSQPPL